MADFLTIDQPFNLSVNLVMVWVPLTFPTIAIALFQLNENDRVALVACEHDRVKPIPCTPGKCTIRTNNLLLILVVRSILSASLRSR